MSLLLSAVAMIAASGVPGLFMDRRSMLGQYVSVLLAVTGTILGMAATVRWLAVGGDAQLLLPWTLPGAEFHVGLDGLSAFFLFPIFLISMLGTIYGLAYWKQTEHADNGRKLRLFYGLLTAGMALLVIARNGILFLYGWELMAMSAFFLVTTEDREVEVREAGWIYLVATHISTLLLFVMFALMFASAGTFELVPLDPAKLGSGGAAIIFLLALVAFGIKAGIMPLHVWLPSSHAIAPSHVSALMSGVIIKMGIYGLMRILQLLPTPPIWAGVLLLVLGAISGIMGVACAIGQHDLKRLLAYHSVENIGIIVIGLGLATVGRALDQPVWVALGLSGALLHVWNHALFKSLLFLSAGSVIHAVHTREIDELGGLAKTMPRTALCFLIGAAAICGLPPLNGFVSEWLIYLGLYGTLGIGTAKSYSGVALVAPALAMIGALAVACFVKVFGAVFLGLARTRPAELAHESPATMTGPMFVLVACCAVIGLAPMLIAPALERGVTAWLPEAFPQGLRLAELAPLDWVSRFGGILVILVVLVSGLVVARLRRSPVPRTGTWDCGYAAPTTRMQYTSSSFAEMLVGLFAWGLRPKTHLTPVEGLFPTHAAFTSHVDDVVLDSAVLPAARWIADGCAWFRRFQQGSMQAYLMYILAILLVLMVWHSWDFWAVSGWLRWK
jgi:hydrogenase-4 component B